MNFVVYFMEGPGGKTSMAMKLEDWNTIPEDEQVMLKLSHQVLIYENLNRVIINIDKDFSAMRKEQE